MNIENTEKIREALRHLDEETDGIQGLSVFALVMPHGNRGQMNVQILSKGSDTYVAHKLYECMRYNEQLPFDLRNIIMTAAAKYLAEQPDEAKQAFDRTVEKCRSQWRDTKEMEALIADGRAVIDELNSQFLNNQFHQ